MSIIEQYKDYFKIEDKKVLLNSFLHFKERIVAENEDSIEKLIENFQKFEIKSNDLFKKINNTDNKGSFLVKLQNFKNDISTILAIGNFEPIYNRIVDYEKEIAELIEQNRVKNLEIKNALIEEAKVLSKTENWKQTTAKFKELKTKWLKTGAVSTNIQDKLELEFQSYFDVFFDKKKKSFEQLGETISKYEGLINKSKSLLTKENSQNQLIEIQKLWKELDQIPQKEYNKLNKDFNKIHNSYFENSKKQSEKNRVEKAKTDKLALVDELKKINLKANDNYFELGKVLRDKWRKTLPVFSAEGEKIWLDFNYELDMLFEKGKLLSYENTKLLSKKLTPEHVIKEKIRFLKGKIRREKEDFEKMASNLGTFRINNKSEQFSNLLDNKYKLKELKIIVKQDLIKELEK